jgi:hypothetical protein
MVFLNKNTVEDTEIWFEKVCLKEKTLESKYIRRKEEANKKRRDICFILSLCSIASFSYVHECRDWVISFVIADLSMNQQGFAPQKVG